MSSGHVQIQLLGVSFTINTDEDPAYMSQVVEYLKKKSESAQHLTKLNDPLKVAIITGLLLTDELFKEKNRDSEATLNQQDALKAEELADEMIQRIDISLKDLS